MYQDLVAAFSQLHKSTSQEAAVKAAATSISNLYSQAAAAVGKAVTIDADGSVKINDLLFQQALNLVVPPNSDQSKLKAALQSGFAMQANKPIAPWGFFIDPAEVSVLDANAWRAFGFGVHATPQVAQFAAFKNVPQTVLADANLQVLKHEAAQPFRYTLGNVSHRLSAGNLFPVTGLSFPNVVLDVGGGTQNHPGSNPAGGTPDPSQIQQFVNCIMNASYSIQDGLFLVVCFGSDCAQALQGLLSKATSAFIGGALAGVAAAIAQHAVGAGVTAAVTAWGGWVAAGILVSFTYWAFMIAFNVASKGVCLWIPLPWSFGFFGPGWAVGQR